MAPGPHNIMGPNILTWTTGRNGLNAMDSDDNDDDEFDGYVNLQDYTH